MASRVLSTLRASLRFSGSRWNALPRFRGLRFFSSEAEPREQMEYDVVIVGGGPSGLSAAIRLRQLCAQNGTDLKVCVVEKGAEIGAHVLSGNVFDPIALNELIPDWKEKEAPLTTPVKEDRFYFLTEKHALKAPFLPPALHNDGNYIISLGNLCRWLATQAEELGVEIYPGFSASEVLYNESGAVVGVATADQGIAKDGSQKSTYQRGIELRAKQTLVAEGVRGSLAEDLIEKFKLRSESDPQTYGIGLKEVWQIDPSKFESGVVMHTLGWPLPNDVYGGSFLYHMEPNYVLLGFVVGLDYKNPYLSPYEEFQRFKHHPKVRQYLEGGTIVSYGARCINEGGLQAIPKLTFPGGALLGCSAGFVNVPRIKGSHTAMKSGMVAAEAVYERLIAAGEGKSEGLEVSEYGQRLSKSWVYDELRQIRNVHPSFKWGRIAGVIYSALSTFFFKGREPWTFHHKVKDCDTTLKASQCAPINYPKPDGVISFDILTNLQRSGTNHDHDQPSHLVVKPQLADVPSLSIQEYAGPEQRFCPAKVYEFVNDEQGKPRLQINHQNCVHCKTCSIKTPREYIRWQVPPGGQGPKYGAM